MLRASRCASCLLGGGCILPTKCCDCQSRVCRHYPDRPMLTFSFPCKTPSDAMLKEQRCGHHCASCVSCRLVLRWICLCTECSLCRPRNFPGPASSLGAGLALVCASAFSTCYSMLVSRSRYTLRSDSLCSVKDRHGPCHSEHRMRSGQALQGHPQKRGAGPPPRARHLMRSFFMSRLLTDGFLRAAAGAPAASAPRRAPAARAGRARSARMQCLQHMRSARARPQDGLARARLGCIGAVG